MSMAAGVGIGVAVGNENRNVTPAKADTVAKTVATLATERSWTSGTAYLSWGLDAATNYIISVTNHGENGANSGKYYDTSPGTWRCYQTDTITIAAETGYTISTITLTYNQGSFSGTSSGTPFDVNSQSWTSPAATAQVRISGFSVTYTAGTITTHTLTYDQGDHGVYDGSTTKAFDVAENTNAVVKDPSDVGITPASGYKFNNWTDGTNTYDPDDNYPMGTIDHTLTATWTVDSTQSVTFVAGTDTGSTSITKSGITATMSKMDNANYYQIYAKASGTFSIANGNIKRITITCTASGTSEYGPGQASANVGSYTYSGKTGTWVGSSSSVTLTSTNKQIRMTQITVEYEASSTPSLVLSNTPSIVYIGKPVSFTVDYSHLTAAFSVDTDTDYVSASYTGATGTGTATVTLTATAETSNTTITVSSTGATSQTFDIVIETLPTYLFVDNFATYASSWTTTYTSHTVTSTDLDSATAGSFTFSKANKSSSEITDRPVMNGEGGASTLHFTLDSSLSATKVIASLEIKFVRWGTDNGTINLYKGASTGTAIETVSLASATKIGVANLNDADFVLEVANSGSSKSRVGITSVNITLENATPFGTLDHIKVTANPTKLIYQSGENFSSSGLTVYAYDGEDETTAESKDVTSSVTLSVAEGYSFLDSDYPNKEITVSYTESTITKTDSFRVEVYTVQSYSLVDTEPSDWSGTYIIVSSLNSEPVALNGALSNIDVVPNYNDDILVESGTALTGQQCQVEIAKTGEGTYSIKTAFGKYIGNKSDSNAISYYNSPADNTITLESGNAVIKTVGQDGRQLALNANAGQERFRYLKSGESVQLYKLSESSTATTYANSFLSLLSTGTDPVCDADGKTTLSELQAAWELLAGSFDDLSPADKALFQKAYANESGTAVEQAVALYDYIAKKYNTSLETETLTEYNFMGRNITPAGGNIINKITTNNAVIIVIVISVLSLASFGAFFLLRKKKEVK